MNPLKKNDGNEAHKYNTLRPFQEQFFEDSRFRVLVLNLNTCSFLILTQQLKWNDSTSTQAGPLPIGRTDSWNLSDNWNPLEAAARRIQSLEMMKKSVVQQRYEMEADSNSLVGLFRQREARN